MEYLQRILQKFYTSKTHLETDTVIHREIMQLTRDATRYRTYFPTLRLICPKT